MWIVPSEKELEELGLTPQLIDFVLNLTDHPSTFTDYPLDISKGTIMPASESFLPRSSFCKSQTDLCVYGF